MAQLIKLKDYISRYEQDPLYYCSEYPGLKKKFWNSTVERWSEIKQNPTPEHLEHEEDSNKWSKIKRIFTFNRSEVLSDNEIMQKDIQLNKDIFMITDQKLQSVKNVEDLKHTFLDELLKIQLRWASSTALEHSPYNRKNQYDRNLRFFLQRFPDQYLYCHQPVFLIKKAPVELSSIIISPTGLYCVSMMHRRENSVLVAETDKFWSEKYQNEEQKILNPMISLNRTSLILNSFLSDLDFEFPIKKLLICPDSYVDFPNSPQDVQVIDKKQYKKWFDSMRRNTSPIKYNQIRAVQQILQRTSIKARSRNSIYSSDHQNE